MTQQPNPPLGGDEAKVEPVAWRWRQLMHDSMGGWEQKIESYRPGDWVKPENIQDLQPLYAAPVLPVEVREKIARKLAEMKGHRDLEAQIVLEGGAQVPVWKCYLKDADAILSTIKGDA